METKNIITLETMLIILLNLKYLLLPYIRINIMANGKLSKLVDTDM